MTQKLYFPAIFNPKLLKTISSPKNLQLFSADIRCISAKKRLFSIIINYPSPLSTTMWRLLCSFFLNRKHLFFFIVVVALFSSSSDLDWIPYGLIVFFFFSSSNHSSVVGLCCVSSSSFDALIITAK